MTIQEIAARFDALAATAQWDSIVDELYADHCESIEPGTDTTLPSVQGIEAIRAKGRAFNENIEAFHSAYCTPAVIGGNHFAVAMGMDITMKGYGRMDMHEIAVYKVADGKIVSEQFFY